MIGFLYRWIGDLGFTKTELYLYIQSSFSSKNIVIGQVISSVLVY